MIQTSEVLCLVHPSNLIADEVPPQKKTATTLALIVNSLPSRCESFAMSSPDTESVAVQV